MRQNSLSVIDFHLRIQQIRPVLQTPVGILPTIPQSPWQTVRGSGSPSGPLHIAPRTNKKDGEMAKIRHKVLSVALLEYSYVLSVSTWILVLEIKCTKLRCKIIFELEPWFCFCKNLQTILIVSYKMSQFRTRFALLTYRQLRTYICYMWKFNLWIRSYKWDKSLQWCVRKIGQHSRPAFILEYKTIKNLKADMS